MSDTGNTSPPEHLRSRGAMEAGERELAYPPPPRTLTVAVYDNHAHLEIADGENPMDYREHLARAEAVGVAGCIQVGTNVETSMWSAEIANIEPRILAAVAIHPNEAPELARSGDFDQALAVIDELATRPRVVAIGETGLDFFRTPEQLHGLQRQAFIEHIRVAKAHNLALQIHDRNAHREVVEVLLAEGAPERTVFHCFSGDRELAEILNTHGWYASFAGTVTFGNAKPLREALAVIDSGLMLVETDSPFLTPTPFRGQPNSPYMVPYTVRFMAEFREVTEDDLARTLTANTYAVYGRFDDEPVRSTDGN